MTTTIHDPQVPVGRAEPVESEFYVINLYTWVTGECAAVELAARVAGVVESFSEIDWEATTVSQEENPSVEPLKVFETVVRHPDEEIDAELSELVRGVRASEATSVSEVPDDGLARD